MEISVQKKLGSLERTGSEIWEEKELRGEMLRKLIPKRLLSLIDEKSGYHHPSQTLLPLKLVMRGHGGHGNWTFREVLWCKGVLMKSGCAWGGVHFLPVHQKGRPLPAVTCIPLCKATLCAAVACAMDQGRDLQGEEVHVGMHVCACVFACMRVFV